MAVVTAPTRSGTELPPWAQRLVVPAAIVAAGLIVSLIVGINVPSWFDNHLQPNVKSLYGWIILNRTENWFFVGVLTPIADALEGCVRFIWWILRSLRWTGVLLLVGLVGWRSGGRNGLLGGVLPMLGIGILGFWDQAMVTLAEMITAIVISLVIGVGLGIWSARSDNVDRVLRPLLDAAQVMPVFCYLGLVTMAFSIGFPPAVAATIIYAVPPAVRLTNHGLRSVPTVMNEVGQSFGADSRQHLLKVQLPIARRTIMLGLNQVIMMAFGIVVIGSLLGTGNDLGGEVLKGLQKQNLGLAFAAGLAIVFAAVALDRISTGERRTARSSAEMPRFALPEGWPTWSPTAIGAGSVVLLALVTKLVGASKFPSAVEIDIQPTITSWVKWVQENLRSGVPIIGGTQPVSDFLVTNALEPLRKFLVWLPWGMVVGVVAAIAYLSRGWRLGVGCAACLVAIATMGTVPGGDDGRTQMWDHAMNTLSQVLVALVLSVIIAVPIGVWAGRSERVNSALRPVLDVFQVMPQFVYLIPVIFMFGPGRSAGVFASIIYAIPPGIRLTALGLKEVPMAPREAAISFGATPRQELFKVQLPLALRSVLLGVNQTILMVLATVIIAALIGGGGLGLVSLGGFQKQQVQIGQGLAAGISIVLLAIVLDRITQAWGSPRSSQQQRGES